MKENDEITPIWSGTLEPGERSAFTLTGDNKLINNTNTNQMDLKQFEALVDKHSALPGNELYNSNALTGEAGEVANVVKKIYLFGNYPKFKADQSLTIAGFREKKCDELGDLLFYLIRNIKDSGLSVEDVMQCQAEKLARQSEEYGMVFKK